ncbi:MAG: hypothetical protein C4K60_02105 [Ideonella sp. MAG2]|nr:MAG: hypothetical protein C4K60_02105 [Ideonella sp. MAG2]
MSSRRLDQLRIRHLQFIGLLASRGSLAATAEHLSLSPSAASMMLKEIEGIFGAKLFRRQGRGMALTPEGAALMPRCQTVLGEVGAMRTTLLDASQALLRIGAFPHTTTTVLPAIVRHLIQGPPTWRLQVFDHSAEQLLAMLQRGEIDVLLGRLPSGMADSQFIASLAQRALYQSELVVVARPGHPLAGRPALSMGELLDWPWVLPSTHSTTRMAVTNAYLQQGLVPPLPQVESPSFFYSLSLVAETDLLTCCAESAAKRHHPQTVILPVSMPLEASSVALIWRKDSAQARRAVEQLVALNLRA